MGPVESKCSEGGGKKEARRVFSDDTSRDQIIIKETYRSRRKIVLRLGWEKVVAYIVM